MRAYVCDDEAEDEEEEDPKWLVTDLALVGCILKVFFCIDYHHDVRHSQCGLLQGQWS